MTKFLSGRQKNLKIGITSYSENTQVLGVIGRVGIGSTVFSAGYDLDVRGTSRFSGNVTLGANLYPDTDGLYDVGRAPQIGLGANRWKDANFLGKGTFGTGVSAHDIEIGVGAANLIYSTSGNLELNSQSGTTNIDDIVTISGNLGIGTVNPQQKLWVEGNGYFSGILTAQRIISSLYGEFISGTSIVGTALSISGISTFTNGPVLIGGGTSTGTAGQILQVSGINSSVYIGGNLGIGTTNPTSKLWVDGDGYFTGVVTATTFIGNLSGTATTATNLSNAANITTGTIDKDRLLNSNSFSVLGDLYVSNNISFGGTTTQLNTQQLQIVDADIVLGIGTSFSPTDNTANHGGIAIASTEGSPLVNLNIVPEETNPSTYKKIMWFKGSSIGAGITDAWLFNYAVGVGSTRVPNGVRLAAGGMQVTDTTISTPNLNVSGVGTFQSSGLKIRNPANTFGYTIAGGAIAADRTLTLPVVTSNTGIAVTGLAQTFTGTQTFSSGFIVSGNDATFSNVTTNIIATSQTTGAITLGGPSQTGGITLGQSTVPQTVGIATGASGVGTTKTINFGTGGGSGSFTQINIGPTAGVGTVTINSGTNLGIGTTTPTSALTVVGNVLVSGVSTLGITTTTNLTAQQLNISGITTVGFLTATNISVSGIVTSNAYYIGTTQVISSARQLQNIASLDATTTATIESAITNAPNTFTDLQVTGVSTFVNGPVLIGTGTSTGTANQRLQVTGGAYVSGNLGIGTTNPQAKFHSYGTDNTLSTVLGAQTNTLIEVEDGNPWSIAFRRTDLGPTADVAAGWIDNNRNFLIANGLPDGGFRYSVGLHTEYVKLYAYDQERFSTLGVGATVIGTLFANQLSVSGITTVGFLTATNISVSGVTTSSAYYIGTSQVISSARQLQNIASLDATTTATIETAIQQAPNDFTSLNISGISTLQSTTLIGGGTSTGTAGQVLQVTGINSSVYIGGNLGIGTTNPEEKLQVDGNIRVGVSATSNYIAFRGTTGDDQPLYNHTYIGERIWGGYESSELLLFKGNDINPPPGYGPDRIRLAASQVRIDTYATSTSGTFDSVGISTNLINRVVVHSTGEVGIGTSVLTGTANQLLQVNGSAYVSGNLGIGITNTSNKLEVIGGDVRFATSSQGDIQITHANLVSTIKGGTTTQLALGGNGAEVVRINSTGVGIGTTNPTSKLHVVGDTYISGILTATDINSASDIRLKTNIKPFENTLEKIVQINGVSFNWIDSNAKSGGIIAQDVEKVFPELVNDGDHKTVNYNGLIGVLIESIKELKQEVEDLKSRLSET